MIKFIFATLVIISLFSPAFSLEKRVSLKQSIEEIKKEIISGDPSSSIALEGIIRSKVKRYAHQAEGKKSFVTRTAGNLADLSEPVITRMATGFVIKHFKQSSPALRQAYLSKLTINKIGDNGYTGYVIGTFLGGPIVFSALNTDHHWLIVGAESPVLDREFKIMLKILHIPYN